MIEITLRLFDWVKVYEIFDFLFSLFHNKKDSLMMKLATH